MERILYYGIFFDEETKKIISSLDINKLDVVPKDLHVTFKYLPDANKRINDVVGKSFPLKIIGIANNGKNSGVLIELSEEVKKYYDHYYVQDGKVINIIPHLTLSISKDSKNMYTRDLDFKMLKEPITITGTFGYCIEPIPDDKNSRYITFKKVL